MLQNFVRTFLMATNVLKSDSFLEWLEFLAFLHCVGALTVENSLKEKQPAPFFLPGRFFLPILIPLIIMPMLILKKIFMFQVSSMLLLNLVKKSSAPYM